MFLYNLLSNVTFEKNTDFIANANQANRIDIINTIEHDLLNDNDISIDESQTKVTRLVLKGTKNYIISITENTLVYYVNNDIQNTWKIKGGKLGEINCENTLGGTTTSDNITECKSDSYNTPIVCTDNVTSLDSIKITECTIPVYTTNADNSKDNNNTLDDITFSFIK